jgi:hypothetical protein
MKRRILMSEFMVSLAYCLLVGYSVSRSGTYADSQRL